MHYLPVMFDPRQQNELPEIKLEARGLGTGRNQGCVIGPHPWLYLELRNYNTPAVA